MPILQKVIEGAKEEFADAVANGGGVYAVGYCFGGKYVLMLGSELSDGVTHEGASTDEEQSGVKKAPLIKVGAMAHGQSFTGFEFNKLMKVGTMITQQDLDNVHVPVTLVCVGMFASSPAYILSGFPSCYAVISAGAICATTISNLGYT